MLSRAGKEILLKIVVQAVPNYVMNVFLFPKELYSEIERMFNSFWWGCGSEGHQMKVVGLFVQVEKIWWFGLLEIM